MRDAITLLQTYMSQHEEAWLYVIMGGLALLEALFEGLENLRQARNRKAFNKAYLEATGRDPTKPPRDWWRYAQARLERNRKR